NFTYCLTLFSKFFSSFPHGTCSLSVSRLYLALDGMRKLQTSERIVEATSESMLDVADEIANQGCKRAQTTPSPLLAGAAAGVAAAVVAGVPGYPCSGWLHASARSTKLCARWI
ncbi:hypothetical protein BX666DRAFT_2038958, partial [Dichotomocladium elegans]